MNKINLSQFFSGINEVIDKEKETRKIKNKTESNDYNIFNQFFKLGENKTSELLAFFIDPNETHGQGNVFLKSFLELNKIQADLCLLDSTKIEVITERIIENDRRIDLYIDFDNGKYVIAIENKLGAEDQAYQLFDYDIHLHNYAKQYKLVYLNKFGDKASKNSITKDGENLKQDYIGINYREHIIPLLEIWKPFCKSPRITYLLEDFIQYLNLDVNNEQIMNNHTSEIAKHIIAKNEVETAFKINESIGLIKEKLFEKLKKELGSLGFILDNNFGNRQTEANFKLKNDIDFTIGFDLHQDSFYVGILNAKDSPNTNQYHKKLIATGLSLKLGEVIEYDRWAWVVNPSSYKNWNTSEPWIAISNGEIKKYLENIIAQLNRVE